jgi:hypothetical protein
MNTSLINTNNPSIYTPEYTIVSNVSTLNSALQPLFQAEVLAIDCETTGLDRMALRKAETLVVQATCNCLRNSCRGLVIKG